MFWISWFIRACFERSSQALTRRLSSSSVASAAAMSIDPKASRSEGPSRPSGGNRMRRRSGPATEPVRQTSSRHQIRRSALALWSRTKSVMPCWLLTSSITFCTLFRSSLRSLRSGCWLTWNGNVPIRGNCLDCACACSAKRRLHQYRPKPEPRPPGSSSFVHE